MRALQELRKADLGRPCVAVAAADDREVLAAVKSGRELGLRFALVGPASSIRELAGEAEVEENAFDLVDEGDRGAAVRVAIDLVRRGEAQVLMKGSIGTADLLRPVLDRETGLRTGSLLSHVAAVELPGPRVALITDAGLNVAPNLGEKADIIRNAAWAARGLGIERPLVAVLAAVEFVNPAMPASLDAAALSKMAERGQLGNIVVDGPLSLDNAVSPRAAERKGVAGGVAGAADILLVPEIVCGNVLYKALVHVAGFGAAGVVVGAGAPIVLTSRADNRETKLNSLCLAALLCRRAS